METTGRLTENSCNDLETDELVVLEQFDERKREQRQKLSLSKYLRPVSQR